VKFQTIDAIYGSILLTMVLTIGCCALFDKYTTASPSDPQRYTVHFDGIDYQDLTRDYHGLSRSRAAYKTRAGKRIEFHGNFYEVEQ
jgi:hypothetical protein